ncbi:MAG: phosphate ABC transporter permease subunit PstC, partial [Chloroflexota bacterium]|nr:phosphate ABC transporter permease subunit PstC [Chloroflexota bacterium]
MFRERIIRYLLLLVAFSALGSLALITIFIFKEGLPLIVKVGLWRFIFGSDWSPSRGSFGILSMIIGSLWVTAGALIFGVP